jgi:hypothetical protein
MFGGPGDHAWYGDTGCYRNDSDYHYQLKKCEPRIFSHLFNLLLEVFLDILAWFSANHVPKAFFKKYLS